MCYLNQAADKVQVPGKKRIQVLADSDSEADVSSSDAAGNAPKKLKTEFSAQEKEKLFAACVKLAGDYEATVSGLMFYVEIDNS